MDNWHRPGPGVVLLFVVITLVALALTEDARQRAELACEDQGGRMVWGNGRMGNESDDVCVVP